MIKTVTMHHFTCDECGMHMESDNETDFKSWGFIKSHKLDYCTFCWSKLCQEQEMQRHKDLKAAGITVEAKP